MEMKPPPSSGRIIFREGLIFGVSLGIVYIGWALLGLLLAQSGLGVLLGLLNVLLWLGVFFWAGARGAKQTGRVGTGSLTGLMTAVFAGLIALVGLLVIDTPMVSQQIANTLAQQHRAGSANPAVAALVILIIVGIILWLLGIGTGAGIGALGGLLGRSQSTVVPPTGPTNPDGYWQPPVQPPYAPPQYPPSPLPPYQNQPPQWPQQ